jgi:hypothetical protein
MMTHGCMLWGSALYNNGAVPNKWARYGESYSMCGVPQRVQTVWKPDELPLMQYEVARKGVLPFLDPMPHFEITQPGNILRIFERGGRFRPEIGVPEPSGLIFLETRPPHASLCSFVLHERIPNEGCASVFRHHHRDSYVNSHDVDIVPFGQRVERVHEPVLGPNFFSVTILDVSLHAHRGFRQER